MEDIFKQKLLSMTQAPLPTTFGEALFGQVHWNRPRIDTKEVKLPATEVFSEKKQVIQSLERFAQENIEPLPEKKILIPGGEIAIKADPLWENVTSFENQTQLLAELSLDPRVLSVTLKNKSPGEVKILFLTETFRTFDEVKEELKDEFLDELKVALPTKTAELFFRMIGAMKLTQDEVVVYPTENDEKDLSLEAMKIISFYRPEVIITLGAKATQRLLKGQERLAMIHGQFFPWDPLESTCRHASLSIL